MKVIKEGLKKSVAELKKIADKNNQEYVTTQELNKIISEISGCTPAKWSSTRIRGYNNMSAGSFQTTNYGESADVYFYKNKGEVKNVIKQLKKMGFEVDRLNDIGFTVNLFKDKD